MKKNITILLALVLLLLGGHPARCQVARYYNLFSQADGSANDLTATLPAGTTNQIVLLGGTVTNQAGAVNLTAITSSNVMLKCHEFNNCGFTYQSTGIAPSTNGVFGVLIYASMSRGAVIDQNPRWSFTTNNLPPGTQTFQVQTQLDLTGIDILYFSFINGSPLGYQTNVIAGVELKSPKYGAKPSTQ